MQYTKKYLNNIIQGVFDSDKKVNEKINIEEFKQLYFSKVIKRLKQPSGKYKFNRDEYQTSIRLYLYYNNETNIYNLLALAMIENKIFNNEKGSDKE